MIIKKIMYIICMAFLIYCFFFAFQYFMYHLWNIKSPLYYPIAIIYLIAIISINKKMDRWGWYDPLFNDIIEIACMKLALTTITHLF